MEVLEFIIVVIFKIATIIFNPLVIALHVGKKVWDATSFHNLPEVLTFEDDE